MRLHEDILSAMGHTPLVRLRRVVPEAPRVYAKLESFNPGGSVKDRIGLSMVEAAEKDGSLQPGGTIVEGTSGNTGVGLALVAAMRGYRVVFTMPDKMAVEKERLLRAYGAEVIRCPTNVEPDDPRSYYSTAKRIADETENAVYLNQYFNQANPEAHVRTTGPEIWQDTEGSITHFVCGVGTGGTISGVGRYLKQQNEAVRIIGVDPIGSILKDVKDTGEGGEAHTYLIEGIGEDIVPSTVWFDVIDDMVRVDDQGAYDMTRRLAIEEGILAGSSAGAAVLGVRRAIDEGLIDDDALVVVLLPDTGERYLSKAFDAGWLRGQGLLPPATTAGEACIHPVPNVGLDEDVARIAAVASARDVRVVAVMDDDRVIGLVSLEDLYARMVADEHADDRTAGELAGPPPPSIDAGTKLGAATANLAKHEALLVTKDGKPFGLLPRRRALQYMGRL